MWLAALFGFGLLFLGAAIFAGGMLAVLEGNPYVKPVGTGAAAVSSDTISVEGFTVLLDPGHGGFDPGKVQGDVMEKDLNLLLALELKTVLEDRGFRVLLTRVRDEDFRSGETLREWKRADLRYRRDLAGALGADVFLSIHMNSFDETTKGTQVFYSREKFLANCLQNAIRDAADPTNHRRAQAADYYVLAENPIPAALIEAGFLSCPADLDRLMEEGYRKKPLYGDFARSLPVSVCRKHLSLLHFYEKFLSPGASFVL